MRVRILRIAVKRTDIRHALPCDIQYTLGDAYVAIRRGSSVSK